MVDKCRNYRLKFFFGCTKIKLSTKRIKSGVQRLQIFLAYQQTFIEWFLNIELGFDMVITDNLQSEYYFDFYIKGNGKTPEYRLKSDFAAVEDVDGGRHSLHSLFLLSLVLYFSEPMKVALQWGIVIVLSNLKTVRISMTSLN